jgi:ABC-type multidrug transport system fused ATPase/permease subunit
MSETKFTKIQSANKINEIYEGATYFDQYGGQVILFIILIIINFLVWSYAKIIVNIQPIKDDWVNERCKPSIIPFAGLINPPEGKTASDFTQENFTYCTQNILTSITGIAVSPINYVFSTLNTIFEEIRYAFQYLRELIDSIRQKFASISEEIYGRVSNVVFAFFPIIIKIKDAIEESRAIMVSGLYTSLGTYYTLKSLMGAIVQIVVIILIALAILVVIMWFCLNFPVAIAGTAFFAVIAAFLIVIIVFCTDVLHIPVPGMPSAPQKPSCFDGETLLKIIDGSYKKIKDIQIGDILAEDGEVTAKMYLSANGIEMYDLFGLTISGSHRIKNKGNWIYVKDHCDAIRINNYTEPIIYCLNTKSKEIHIESIDTEDILLFHDWDEIFENELEILSKNMEDKSNLRENIHKYFDFGFNQNSVIKMENNQYITIQNIKPGMVLDKVGRVYGFVEINGEDLDNNLFYLGENAFLGGTQSLKKMTKAPLSKITNYFNNDKILYNLLTDKGSFYVNGILFNDYNSAIELFLTTD